MEHQTGLRVAVIGSGVAGIVAAYLLQKRHQVTLFEKNDYIGGHTHTVVLEKGPDQGLSIDTGFIVFNDRTYPNFLRFIDRLGVACQEAPMSFSYYDPQTGFMYNSSNLFADRRNRFRLSFWRLLWEIVRFNRKARQLLAGNKLAEQSLGEFLQRLNFSSSFINQYIIPMGAAIWSTPDADMMKFPALTFVRFFDNHGLLTINDQPQWFTIKGGSHRYVQAFLKGFQGKVVKKAPVAKIRRTEQGVRIQVDGNWIDVDRVVMATHADQALRLLDDPTDRELRLLSPWQYTENQVILHTDSSILPPVKQARAAWNYTRTNNTPSSAITMSYYMNHLQKLETPRDYCVSLNSAGIIEPTEVIATLTYHHPLFSFDAVNTQQELPTLNGTRHTYFCGSYFRNGFHEDAVFSAINVGQAFGGEL